MEKLYVYLYLLATALFILGLKRLSGVRTARGGNRLAALGMLIAIVAAGMEGVGSGGLSWSMLLPAMLLGTAIGAFLATKVEMTEMPELVAAFNGVGGLASAVVALSFLANHTADGSLIDLLSEAHDIESPVSTAITLPLSILIGIATLTGSFVAYLKLGGKKMSHPFAGSSRHGVHLLLGALAIVSSLWMILWATNGGSQWLAIVVLVVISGILGVFLTMPIGGADMPVVVALLNSYSGLAAAASGFVIQNLLLVVAGSLVGASGLILTRIMCKAMNRSLGNVLLGGIGDDSVAEDAREYSNIKESSPEEVAMLLDAATSVIIVPGYGLAVAQAQHVVRELANELEKRDIQVRYAIHPVAGRMPGHMNVLLAEADVPYEQLWELERINGDFQNTDVVIVVGANDVVNPVAREQGNPISGMPILDVDHAQTVVNIKRSLSPGYAGIKNPLFELDNSLMVFMDAKEALTEMLKEVKEL
ncbi:MAG: NAD(P)(+) transhydrogenase (Re/Si-specific) subunit beta [Planctomycetes bacterium]|nr:NAD(P)(+) transhydrogenase (Re/Si-specific) subunit beta [Planctomycetota bacterium]